MRSLIISVVLLCASTGAAQDTIRRVEAPPVTVSDGVSPVAIDSLPISSSYRRLAPTQAASSLSLEHAVRAVPGLQIDNRNNYALGDRITMRGMGARSFFGTRGIRVYKDDIPLTFADGQTNLEIIDPSQLSAARVIRGPSGHLYGNAAGGSLMLTSVVPPSIGSFAQFSGTMGSWGYQRLSGSLGTRGDDLAYGAYITLDTMTGYRDYSGMKSMHLGTQSIYTFGDDALRFSFDHVSFSAQNPGSLPWDSLSVNRRAAFAQNLARKTGKEGDQSQAGLTYSKSFDSSELISSAYTVLRSALNPTPQQIIDLERTLFGLRSVYRGALTGGSRIDYSMFIDLQCQFDDRTEHANINGNRGPLQTSQEENIFAGAVGLGYVMPFSRFGLGKLKGYLGARYDALNFSATDRLIDSTNPDHSGSLWMRELTMSVGLSYPLSEQHSLFLYGGEGFDTPTATELANQPNKAGGYNTELREQHTRTLELGAKGDISEFLNYNISFYTATVGGALIPFEVEGQEGQTFYRNAGEIENKGAELELVVKPVTGLTLIGAFSVISSKFTDDQDGDANYSKNYQPGVHPGMASLDVTYHTPFGLYVNTTGKWAARVAVNDANDAHSPEYTVVDLKLGYALALGGLGPEPLILEPFVHVHNVFDREYVSSFSINAFGRRYYEPAPERSIFAGMQIAL